MDVKDRLKQLKCCILIPTYNNEQTVRSVVEQARGVCSDVVVVNDGATDSTASVLDCIEGITVLTHEENRGKGEALKTGLRFAAENGFDYAIAMDSDGQHFVDDVPANIEGARFCGIHGAVFYNDVEYLRRNLRAAGVDVAEK